MNQSKIAKQILRLLDPSQRKSSLRLMIAVLLVSLCGLFFANQWESPLAVMPRTFCAIVVGFLMLYIQSVRMYPLIEPYFNKDLLMRDAGMASAPLLPESQDKE